MDTPNGDASLGLQNYKKKNEVVAYYYVTFWLSRLITRVNLMKVYKYVHCGIELIAMATGTFVCTRSTLA